MKNGENVPYIENELNSIFFSLAYCSDSRSINDEYPVAMTFAHNPAYSGSFPNKGVGSIPTRIWVFVSSWPVYNLANCIMHHICSSGLASHNCVISPALLQPAMFFIL